MPFRPSQLASSISLTFPKFPGVVSRSVPRNSRSFAFAPSRIIMAPQTLKVANDGDIRDGEMKEVSFGTEDRKILLSKVDGKVYATSTKCTHYGAPLVKGVLSKGGRILCPWHGACFNACTGDIEDAPALSSLLSFPVTIKNNEIHVEADPAKIDGGQLRPPPKADSKPMRESGAEGGVVIVGGGPAGQHAIEELRESGYQGPITLISKEAYLPIDRTKLSKALIADAGKVALRDDKFYQDLGVHVKLGTTVESVDFDSNSVKLEGGEKVGYENLILATGSQPKKLPVDGVDLKNIFLLRTLDDVAQINEALGDESSKNSTSLVVVGSSFIGMEVAIAGSKKANVTIVGMEKVPFEKILGPQVGKGIQKFHEEKNGTKFYLEASLSHFEPSGSDKSKVGNVVLKSGEKIKADVVVLGVGVAPQTQYLKSSSGASGIKFEKDGSVFVDEYLKLEGVKQGNVFAVGDIAKFKDVHTGDYFRIEHWNVASNHGRAVAKTIAGKPHKYNKIAVFWSAQGQQLRYCGTSESTQWEDVIVKGNPDELKYVAYYTKGDKVVAVSSMQSDPVVSHSSELLRLGKMPSASEIKNGKDPLSVKLVQAPSQL